jgi:hypothetical protein
VAPYYDQHLITTNIFFGASLWCDGFVIVRSLTATQCFTSCIARVLAHPSDRRSERYDQQREPQLSAVVQHLVKQAAVPIGRNRRPQDFNVAHGLDETFRIARRSIDADNDGTLRTKRRGRLDRAARHRSGRRRTISRRSRQRRTRRRRPMAEDVAGFLVFLSHVRNRFMSRFYVFASRVVLSFSLICDRNPFMVSEF